MRPLAQERTNWSSVVHVSPLDHHQQGEGEGASVGKGKCERGARPEGENGDKRSGECTLVMVVP